MSYENGKGFIRFFTGCDAGDVAESDVAVCFDCYMQSDGRLRVVGYRRVDRESARIGDRERWRKVCEKINSI